MHFQKLELTIHLHFTKEYDSITQNGRTASQEGNKRSSFLWQYMRSVVDLGDAEARFFAVAPPPAHYSHQSSCE